MPTTKTPSVSSSSSRSSSSPPSSPSRSAGKGKKPDPSSGSSTGPPSDPLGTAAASQSGSAHAPAASSRSLGGVPPAAPSHAPRIDNLRELITVSIGALGVVYGDIGTSPLYAVKECFSGPHGMAPTPENVYGILSLIFWALLLVVVNKYLSFIMRADNQGEGGTFALLALISPRGSTGRKLSGRMVLVFLALFGASLLFGEGIITPAISVLGAMEGLEVISGTFRHLVVPLTLIVLVLLFTMQRRGTGSMGMIFGPVMLVWFTSISIAGASWIVKHPGVLSAVSPHHAVRFFLQHKLHGFLALGSVVLCITGGEALYADMGHFGKRPIRLAWYTVVFPALLLNYFGQGAYLLSHPGQAVSHTFYEMLPNWGRYPMVLIATAAAVVASQALISGAFSLTRQAVQLGFWPRVSIRHTSEDAEGQIYIPEINYGLMIACLALVVSFKGSSGLAAAYGIAVTGTMTITSILFAVVARERWGYSNLRIGVLLVLFLTVDVSFFSANVAKLFAGGWIPLAIAAGLFTIMTTWKAGRAALEQFILSASLPLDLFLGDLGARNVPRVPGTAVFMTSNPEGTPVVLLHHFKHNKLLHEQIVLLSIITDRVPEVPKSSRVSVKDLGQGFFQVIARYGFMQTPSVTDILRCCREVGMKTKENDTSYFLGRETLITTGKSGLSTWRIALFSFLSKNARTATAFFGIPPNRVVEMGAQIEL